MVLKWSVVKVTWALRCWCSRAGSQIYWAWLNICDFVSYMTARVWFLWSWICWLPCLVARKEFWKKQCVAREFLYGYRLVLSPSSLGALLYLPSLLIIYCSLDNLFICCRRYQNVGHSFRALANSGLYFWPTGGLNSGCGRPPHRWCHRWRRLPFINFPLRSMTSIYHFGLWSSRWTDRYVQWVPLWLVFSWRDWQTTSLSFISLVDVAGHLKCIDETKQADTVGPV